MNKDIKLRFGKYKGVTLKDVPDNYLRWCLDNNVLKGKAMCYAKQRLNYPKDKYLVIVEDAAVGDGEYIVDAYNEHLAIRTAQKLFNIQSTQSYHGTSYSATKL